MKTKRTNSLLVAACVGIAALGSIAGLTGCAGNRTDRSTGEYIDDKSLDVRVHDALKDNAEYKFDDVNVTSFRGTVQLSGFVDTSAQKSKAGEIAKNVEGVKDIENNISVKE
jgi:hyperosmotically inducible periplasmic protein